MPSLNLVPSFPPYSGPYPVGTREYEIPVSELVAADVPSPPKEGLSTLKFRAFYPTTSTDHDIGARSRFRFWPRDAIPVYWLPEPQTKWVNAYAAFMGMSGYLPNFLSYIKIPARANAPLLPLPAKSTTTGSRITTTVSTKYPVVIFSHGLGGSSNAYSHLLGSLASHGVCCFALEHRDQSAPIAVIRTPPGDGGDDGRKRRKQTEEIRYQALQHDPTPEVLKSRNEQLGIRLWELELMYRAVLELGLKKGDEGRSLTNLATGDDDSEPSSNPCFMNALLLDAGTVSFAGHSFGATSIVQLVKGVYYHGNGVLPPKLPSSSLLTNESAKPVITSSTTPPKKGFWTPSPSSPLISQITPHTPTVLLDTWTMPLRGDTTKHLWELPLPCYYRQHTDTDANNDTHDTEPTSHASPDQEGEGSNAISVLSIMSSEWHGYKDLLRRTRALFSLSPAHTFEMLSSSSHNALPNQGPGRGSDPSLSPVRLFYIPSSLHLSQSDFGILFQWVLQKLMPGRQEDAEGIVRENVEAVIRMLRGKGLIGEGAGDGVVGGREAWGKGTRLVRIEVPDSVAGGDGGDAKKGKGGEKNGESREGWKSSFEALFWSSAAQKTSSENARWCGSLEKYIDEVDDTLEGAISARFPDFNHEDVRAASKEGSIAHEDYLSREEVKKAIGARVDYVGQSEDALNAFLADGDGTHLVFSKHTSVFVLTGSKDARSFLGELSEIVRDGVNVLIWKGDANSVCDWSGTLEVANTLDWDHRDEFARQLLKPYIVNRTEKGAKKGVENLTFMRFFEAGHYLAFYRQYIPT
ncbi:MAG: hypothetical protein Q9160_005053 [Pyrenula sp. 1 TL-2023]